MCVFFSTEKWSIKYGSYCIVATAQMKFASEARPSQYIGPFGNTEPTCMPLSGHFMDIEGRVLVYQTERYQLSLKVPLAIQSRLVCHYLDTLWTLRVGS